MAKGMEGSTLYWTDGKLTKLKRIAVVCFCLLLTVIGPAQAGIWFETEMTWDFHSQQNPATPSLTPLNPLGVNGTASILGEFNDYFFGNGPEGLYGSPSGLWAVFRGEIRLELPHIADVAECTVVIRQFMDPVGFCYPGQVSFSKPGAVAVGRTVVEPQTGNMVGWWVEDTYQWTDFSPAWNNHLSLSLAPAEAGNSNLLIDSVRLNVLSEIPEPTSLQMILVGVLVVGLRAWSRREDR